jgi:hypothetical protein
MLGASLEHSGHTLALFALLVHRLRLAPVQIAVACVGLSGQCWYNLCSQAGGCATGPNGVNPLPAISCRLYTCTSQCSAAAFVAVLVSMLQHGNCKIKCLGFVRFNSCPITAAQLRAAVHYVVCCRKQKLQLGLTTVEADLNSGAFLTLCSNDVDV